MYKRLLLFIFILSGHQVFSQQSIFYEKNTTPVVIENGHTLLSPWCGGMNSIQANKADLNQDNLEDLILFDHHTRYLKTFINTGASGQIKYQYDPKYEANFPEVIDYLLLRDYNQDNIPDLFHRGIVGVSVYKGYYQNNELKFNYFKDLYHPGNFGPVNVYVQPEDIPILEDLDKDGDLDMVSYDVLGSWMNWYKNLQVEDNLPPDSIRMSLETTCWGECYGTFYRTFVLGASCKGNINTPVQNKKIRHTGNCMLAVDIDGNGLFDLLNGNISFSDLQLLYNNGTLNHAVMNTQDTLWDTNGHEHYNQSWAAPFFIDMNNDNVKDIVVGVHADNDTSADYNCLSYYKNSGTNTAPNLTWQHDSLLVHDMIDVGTSSSPVLFDYDKDGKPDLFVGKEKKFIDPVTLNKSAISYYKNTSTPGNPSFELVTHDFLNLSAQGYSGIFPAFGDLDRDGITDLLLGHKDGTLSFYKNNAASEMVQPGFSLNNTNFNSIDVGGYAHPLIYDLDKDSDMDIIIGNDKGRLVYYADSATGGSANFKWVTNTLGGVKALPYFGFASPYIGICDTTQTEYLLVGDDNGNIQRYGNLNNLNTFTLLDSNYSLIQEAARATPIIGDVDSNGKLDLIVGTRQGGLSFYTYKFSIVYLPAKSYTKLAPRVFPNPATDQLFVQVNSSEKISYQILDISGRIYAQGTFTHNEQGVIPLHGIPTGIYFLKLTDKHQSTHVKFIKHEGF